VDAPDPIARFRETLARASTASPHDATAAALATADARGRPSVRIVLVKGVDARGFAFHTNRESRKGRELAENPRAALCFHWPALGQQVRAEGPVSLLPDAESDAYFATRPRGSQLGAWASTQSAVIPGRGDLDQRARDLEANYAGRPVPRPPHWGGYRVIPLEIEFWQGRQDRLHDRFVYRLREPKDWIIERLSP
jgi:pyridoxamine 5'-phosphate oxidase